MKKILSGFLLGTLILSSTAFTGCEKKDQSSINNNEKLKNITMPQKDGDSINLELYFDSSSTNKETEIAKEERVVNPEELLGEIIMQELLKGPSNVSKLKPIFPKEVRLLSFSIQDGIAYVNLSTDAKVTMTPAKEEACLRAILNSLNQLPSVNKVSIMVDSKNVDSLGGNYDISKPFGKEEIENLLKK